MIKFDDEVKEILGRPNFSCAGIAEMLRKKGFEIKHKSEDEQANVLYWMLSLYEKHGFKWKDEANTFLQS